MNEIWKDIENYEGLYQISNLGRIKSLERLVSNGNGIRKISEKIITPRKWNNHYFQVKLSKNGKVKTLYVHRLVAEVFITKEKPDHVVNHKDGNGFNNCVSNLEWCSQKYNICHAWKNGMCETIRSSAHRSKGAPLNKVVQIDSSNKIVDCFSSVYDAMKKLDLTEAQVRGSINRNSKKYGLRWEKMNYAN